jgi:hypothetical protein
MNAPMPVINVPIYVPTYIPSPMPAFNPSQTSAFTPVKAKRISKRKIADDEKPINAPTNRPTDGSTNKVTSEPTNALTNDPINAPTNSPTNTVISEPINPVNKKISPYTPEDKERIKDINGKMLKVDPWAADTGDDAYDPVPWIGIKRTGLYKKGGDLTDLNNAKMINDHIAKGCPGKPDTHRKPFTEKDVGTIEAELDQMYIGKEKMSEYYNFVLNHPESGRQYDTTTGQPFISDYNVGITGINDETLSCMHTTLAGLTGDEEDVNAKAGKELADGIQKRINSSNKSSGNVSYNKTKEHISKGFAYDPIPWIGLRRPETVKGMPKDPTKVTNIDERLHADVLGNDDPNTWARKSASNDHTGTIPPKESMDGQQKKVYSIVEGVLSGKRMTNSEINAVLNDKADTSDEVKSNERTDDVIVDLCKIADRYVDLD